jgi:hypothetical protein
VQVSDSKIDAIARPPRGVLGLIVFIALLFTSLANFGQLTPAWQAMSPHWPQAMQERTMANFDALFIATAHGGNLAMHFDGFNPANTTDGKIMSELYFRANYALYPKRCYVGDGKVIINVLANLTAADRVPPDVWLKSHRVNGVVTISFDPAGAPHVQTRSIPQ